MVTIEICGKIGTDARLSRRRVKTTEIYDDANTANKNLLDHQQISNTAEIFSR